MDDRMILMMLTEWVGNELEALILGYGRIEHSLLTSYPELMKDPKALLTRLREMHLEHKDFYKD